MGKVKLKLFLPSQERKHMERNSEYYNNLLVIVILIQVLVDEIQMQLTTIIIN